MGRQPRGPWITVIYSVIITVIQTTLGHSAGLMDTHRAGLRQSEPYLFDQTHHFNQITVRCQYPRGDDSVASTGRAQNGLEHSFRFAHQDNEILAARAMTSGEPVLDSALAGPGPAHHGL